uniref:Uncharacterized protein n=1 Tax=Kalanchoe fedtschenkoi TaxID=63787 RepID=A0A7N0UGT1_KALFE
MGLVLFIISLLGMIGLSYRIKCLLWVYLVLIVVRIALHLLLMAIGFVSIHNQKAFSIDYSKGEEEYKTEHFADFARNYIDGARWEASRSCLLKYNLCRKFDVYHSSMPPKDFMLAHPVMWGCCQPPASCGYRYQSEQWAVPEAGIQSNDTDCYKYSNNKDVLCSNCDTCKAGFLAFMYGDWVKMIITNSVILGLFLLMIITGVNAIRHMGRNEEKY